MYVPFVSQWAETTTIASGFRIDWPKARKKRAYLLSRYGVHRRSVTDEQRLIAGLVHKKTPFRERPSGRSLPGKRRIVSQRALIETFSPRASALRARPRRGTGSIRSRSRRTTERCRKRSSRRRTRRRARSLRRRRREAARSGRAEHAEIPAVGGVAGALPKGEESVPSRTFDIEIVPEPKEVGRPRRDGLEKTSSGAPVWSSFPSNSSPRISESCNASSQSCVTRRVVIPVFRWRARMKARIDRRRRASRLEKGSSSRRMRGRTASARASATLCFCPPEISPGSFRAHSSISTRESISAATCRCSPREAPAS